MADTELIPDYAVEPPKTALPWQSVVALPLPLVGLFTSCMCGHFDWWSSLFTIPAAALAWWGFLRPTQRSVFRVVIYLAVVLGSLVFAKNIADVLWYGHEPVFRLGGPK